MQLRLVVIFAIALPHVIGQMTKGFTVAPLCSVVSCCGVEDDASCCGDTDTECGCKVESEESTPPRSPQPMSRTDVNDLLTILCAPQSDPIDTRGPTDSPWTIPPATLPASRNRIQSILCIWRT